MLVLKIAFVMCGIIYQTFVLCNYYIIFTALPPSVAPNDFTPTTTTSSSISFQWTPLSEEEANGIVNWYIISCNESIVVSNEYNLFYLFIY